MSIKKVVTGSLDEDGNALTPGLKFPVTVTGPDPRSPFTFDIAHDETEVLSDLVVGDYLITETPSVDPKTVTIDGVEGTSKTIAIGDKDDKTVTITNNYYGVPDVRAELNWTCTDPLTGTLHNDGDVPATFTVTYAGTATPHTHVVLAGGSEVINPPAGATGVTVSFNGEVIKSQTKPGNCHTPGAPSFELICNTDGSSSVKVTLTDTGPLDSEFRILVNGELKGSKTGGGPDPVTVDVVKGDVVTVTANGTQVGSFTPDPDCVGTPTASVVCAPDGSSKVVVTITGGDSNTEYKVTIGSNPTVTEKGPSTVEATVAEGDSVKVTVTGGGATKDFDLTVDCIGDAGFQLVCVPGDASKVTVTITGGSDTTEYKVFDGTTEVGKQTGPGPVSVPVTEGSTVTLSVKAGTTDVGTQTFIVDCYQLDHDYNRDCTTGYEITLANGSTDPGHLSVTYTVTITVDGATTTADTYTLAPNDAPKVINGTVPEGKAAHVQVTADDGTKVIDDSWTQRCTPPPPPPPGDDPPGDDPPGDDPPGEDPNLRVALATSVCAAPISAPYLDFTLEGGEGPVTVIIQNPQGDDIIRTGLDESGRVLFPGAEIAADGTVTAWPGWIQNADGTWSVGGPFEWVLDGVTVRFEQGDQSVVRTIAYPAANPEDCGPEIPSEVGSEVVEVGEEEEEEEEGSDRIEVLPRTGGTPLATGLVAFTLAIVGTALVAVERRGFQVAGERRR